MRGDPAQADRTLVVPRLVELDGTTGNAVTMSMPATIGDPGLVVQHVHLVADGSLTLPDASGDADHAVVLIRGAVELRTGANGMTAGRGDLVYRPAGQLARFHATDDTELVIVRTSQRPPAL